MVADDYHIFVAEWFRAQFGKHLVLVVPFALVGAVLARALKRVTS
jgi:hypothetical protein